MFIASVDENAVLLTRHQLHGDVGRGLDVERLHLHVGGVVPEAQRGQVLTALP